MGDVRKILRKRVILDVDVGADDALAILMLLYAERKGFVKIEAITCVSGNTTVDNVARNVVRILEAANRTDIPVYKGAYSSFLTPEIKGDGFYGEDGFGDLKWETEPDLGVVKKEIAAVKIGELVSTNPEEISILACGPVTNLALAIKMYPNFAKDVKEIFVMGGNHNGVGNISAAAEFNFYLDPEAAEIVFQNSEKLVHLLTWETTLGAVIDVDWRFKVLGAVKNPLIEMLNRVDATVFPIKSNVWKPADAFMVAAFLFPEKIIKSQKSYPATVELHGSTTRGQVVIDRKIKTKPNIMLIDAIFREHFEKLIVDIAKDGF